MLCPACKHASSPGAACRLVSFCPAHKTGGCRCCAVPRGAPAVLVLHCAVTLGFNFTEELETRLRSQDSRADEALSVRCSWCLCPGGREQAEGNCSCVPPVLPRAPTRVQGQSSWESYSFAGLGTCKRQSTRLPQGWGQGPGKAWPQVPMVALAYPLCSRRAWATCSGLAWPEPGGCALDLPASPYSLQCQLAACQPQHCQHHSCPTALWYWRPASPARLCQGCCMIPQHFVIAGAPAHLGPTTGVTACTKC